MAQSAEATIRSQVQVLLRQIATGDPVPHKVLFQILRSDINRPAKKQAALVALLAFASSQKGSALQFLVHFAHGIAEEKPILAYKLMERANLLGSLNAKCNLAVLHIYGKGTPVNINQAIQILKECHDAGYAPALTQLRHLANQCLKGTGGVSQDLNQAEALFCYLAKLQDLCGLEGMTELAVRLNNGEGCRHNRVKAIELFSLAAGMGFKNAQHYLEKIAIVMAKSNHPKRFLALTEANRFGNPEVKHALAMYHLRSKELDVAIELYKEIYAINRDPNSLNKLFFVAAAYLLFPDSIDGIEGDAYKGADLIVFLAQQGHPDGRDLLPLMGTAFYWGHAMPLDQGCYSMTFPTDAKRGIELLQIAIKLNIQNANVALDLLAVDLMSKGFYSQGFELLKPVAEFSDYNKKYNLALAYFHGHGTRIELHKARALFEEIINGDEDTEGTEDTKGFKKMQEDSKQQLILIKNVFRLFDVHVLSCIEMADSVMLDNEQRTERLQGLFRYANDYLRWVQFDQDLGIPEDLPRGLRILTWLENRLEAARNQLEDIKQFFIPPLLSQRAALTPEMKTEYQAVGQRFMNISAALRTVFPEHVKTVVCDYIPEEVPLILIKYERAQQEVKKNPNFVLENNKGDMVTLSCECPDLTPTNTVAF